ncbi:uncharacterized oxidoreductase YccK-like [Paramacrobiotus metropolitanus]|uniref:uncharacterized oxidoreductase YccK-like n=1 Tax=Paramacrobiotus metropolitanus TaxID=2943436 RepID=UPI00244609EB|nr:uncharacterized oxidoreductase YccK-like [Paramacrobiotus metropolitanus]
MSANTMSYQTLPGTDLNVSRICLGTWQFNGGAADLTWDRQDEATSKAIVDKALRLGINFFDTAEAYTNSEAVLGRILQGSGQRSQVIIASKFGQCLADGRQGYTAADIEKALTKSLEQLQTTYIDLYQIHWPICVADMKEAVEQLEREVQKGRIRYYGHCNFGVENMNEFEAAGGRAVSSQLAYNLLWRPIEHEILPKVKQLNMSVLAYSPLQQGLLTGKYHTVDEIPTGRKRTRLFSSNSSSAARHGQAGAEVETFEAIDNIRKICADKGLDMSSASLSWLLGEENVASVIVGCSSPEQLEANTKITHLDQDTQKRLRAATDRLKAKIGSNCDLWAAESRIK